MGVEPPFIYDKPSSYTFDGPINRGFNPKAVTQASWMRKPPKPKQDGPLVNFNRHPDSYYQSPYGNVRFKPMNPNTKGRVKLAWRIQRILRVLALLGALGGVFCIITIRNMSTAIGWIIRVGPAVALGHALYATYFLCRGINSRPPASCASYQMFAGLLDAGLLPFFAISCYMATMDHTSNTYGWGTLFNDRALSYDIIQAFMILTGAEGGLLAVSLVFDVYLAVTYRKITHMPPDMNPLEDKEKDNLTGAGRKHKRNKSELLHDKHLSNSTFASERFSQISEPAITGRRIPFKHSRTDSTDRDSFSVKQDSPNGLKDPYRARASMAIERGSGDLSRPSSAVTPAANARPAGVGLEHKPARSSALARTSTLSRPNSWLSSSNYECMPAEISDFDQYEREAQGRSMSPVSALSDHEIRLARSRPQSQPQRDRAAPTDPDPEQENMPCPEQLSLALPPAYTPPRKRSREPLGMNPPTPVYHSFETIDPKDEGLVPQPLSTTSATPVYATPPRQGLREADSNSVMYATPASRPSSFVGSGTKSRFYGDLRNSLGGSPTRMSHGDIYFEEPDVHRSDTVKTAESGNFEVYGSDGEDEYDPYNSQNAPQHGPPILVDGTAGSSPGREWNGQRQTSNSTGYDLQGGYAGLDPEFGRGMARRREVSGKVAEEGRVYEAAMPATPPTQGRLGAAGWARFKGL